MRALRVAIAITLLSATIAVGHEPSQHKGRATDGEVVSVAEDNFALKTSAGTITVTFTDTTKFELGERAAGKEELKQGTHVSVLGTKLPSGELVAREVVVHSSKRGAPRP